MEVNGRNGGNLGNLSLTLGARSARCPGSYPQVIHTFGQLTLDREFRSFANVLFVAVNSYYSYFNEV